MSQQDSSGRYGDGNTPRLREVSTVPAGELPAQRYEKLLRLLAFVVPALATGLLMVPHLGRPSFPVDPALLGTPASENIKAPHDVSIVDEEMTARLQEDALTQVRRVYDHDVALGKNISQAVIDGFAAMRDRAADVVAGRPEYEDLQKLSRTAKAAIKEEMGAAFRAARTELEQKLGVVLRKHEAVFLDSIQYDAEFAQGLAEIVRDTMQQPIVASRVAFDGDKVRGIAIQRVPDDGAPHQVASNVEEILELPEALEAISGTISQRFGHLPRDWRETLTDLAARLIEPNLTLNRAGSELAREMARLTVNPATVNIKKGEMVIRDGERITARHLLIFRGLNQSVRRTSAVLVAVGGAAIVIVLMFIGFAFARGQLWWESFRLRDLFLLTAMFVVVTGGARLWSVVSATLAERFTSIPLEAFLYFMPVAATTMVVRLVLRTELAVLFGVFCSLVLGLVVDGEPFFAIFAMAGMVLGATRMVSFSSRSDLLRAAIWVGAGQAALVAAVLLFQMQTSLAVYVLALGGAFLGGLLAGFCTLAITPVVEAVFGYTTDLKLLELANLNHPALKELIVQAPGSYHHSIIVGTLVEAAAEACGANPLLARVMAYYHDLGKGCNPVYFIENQRQNENPHDKLKPSMSAMVIKRHVTDGLEIAKKHGLGEVIQAGILEHHGTTLIQYFYHKAKELEDEQNPVSENDYRYPGRKPQTRESALVMLGDSVEAASRSLADPTPARLQGLVTRIINQKFTDGQLEECDLTLRDLHVIAKSFSRVLASIYHQRPEYPGVLKDISGTKKQHADSHSKPQKNAKAKDEPPEDDRPDNIRRLGLS